MGSFRFTNKHFIVLMGNGVTSGLGFAMLFVIMHNPKTMSLAHAGMWFFLQTLVGLCEAGRYGFLNTATVKFYAGTDKERGATVMGSIWFLALALSAVVLAINGLAFLYLPFTANEELIMCIKWIGINYLSSLPSDVVFWRLQADEEYTKMFWFRMINACSTLGSFVILAAIGRFTLENVILWNFLTNCSSSLIGLIWYRSGIQYLGKRTKECVREIFHFGKYTCGTTLFASFLSNADIWILNFVLGPASVAIYNVAMRLMAIVELPLRTFATTGISEMAIANNTNNMPLVGHVFQKYSGMLTIALIPVAVIACIFAFPVIQLLGGHHLDGDSGVLAAEAFRLIIILAVSYPIDRFNGMALDITHHTKTNFYKMIIVISIKVVAGLLFTEVLKSLYGIIAANYLSMLIAVAYGHYQLRKYVPHTLGGIISIGYKELILFYKRKISILRDEK